MASAQQWKYLILWSLSNLKMVIGPKAGVIGTVMLLRHSKSSLTFPVTLELGRAMGLVLATGRERK